jgi:sigma-B regulation protein RsbU (phosphoserine phosphatase)
MFITMLYMVLNTRTRELKFARAGHERPLLCRGCNGKHPPEPIDAPGIAVGLADAEVFDAIISDVTVQLQPNDGIVVYTDGITEALNENGEEWGLERMTALVQNETPKDPDQLIKSIHEALNRYVGAREQYDDMTLLAFKVF